MQFQCSCGKTLKVADNLAGKKIRCPACKEVVRLPQVEEEEEVLQAIKPPPARSKVKAQPKMDDEDGDLAPSKKPKPPRDDDDDAPPRRKSRPVDEDEEEEESPSPKKKSRSREDDDFEEDDRRRKKDVQPATFWRKYGLWVGIGGGGLAAAAAVVVAAILMSGPGTDKKGTAKDGGGDKLHAKAKEKDNDETPSVPPNKDSVLSGDGAKPPVNGSKTPGDGAKLPVNGSKTPDDDAKPPIKQTKNGGAKKNSDMLEDPAVEPLPNGALARLGTARFRGSEPGRGFPALAPGGKVLALRDVNDRQSVLDVSTGARLPQFSSLWVPFKGGGDQVIITAFSPDGKIAIGTTFRDVRFFDVASGKQIQRIAVEDIRLDSYVFSKDGKRLAANSRSDAHVFEMPSGKELVKLKLLHTQGIKLALSPDGALLAICGIGRFEEKAKVQTSQMVQFWDVATKKEARRVVVPHEYASAICFSPDGKHLVTSSGYGLITFIFWDAAKGSEARRIESERLENHVNRFLVFSSDGKRLATSDSFGRIQVWDAETGKRLAQHQSPTGQLMGLHFENEERLIAWGIQSRAAWVWDAASRKRLTPEDGHPGQICQFVFSPDGKKLHSLSRDGKVCRWDLSTAKQTHYAILEHPREPSKGLYYGGMESIPMSLSPDGKYVAASLYMDMKIHDADTGKIKFALKSKGGASRFLFSADGRYVVVPKAKGLELFNAADGDSVHFFQEPGQFETLAFSPDNKAMAAVNADSRLFVWDLKSKKELWRDTLGTRVQNAIAFSPDSRQLAAFDEKQRAIVLRDAATGKETSRIPLPDKSVGDALAFSPKGGLIALASGIVVSGALTIQVFDVATTKRVHQFRGHKGLITTLAFSPDESILASGGDDTSILLWKLTEGAKPPAGGFKSPDNPSKPPIKESDGPKKEPTPFDKEVKAGNLADMQKWAVVEPAY